MKNNNTPFAFLLSVFLVIALTGCYKIDFEGDNTIKSFEPNCSCGVVLSYSVSYKGAKNTKGHKIVHTEAKNHCTDNVTWFSSCPDETNPDVPEVGSEFCRDKIW